MIITSLRHKILATLRRFYSDSSGMTLPMLAGAMVAVTGLTGVAVDTGRVQLAQSKLQFSLDAAGLAAGSTASTANVSSEMAKYLNTNFNGYMGSTITGSSVVGNDTNTVLTLSASASVPTTFMKALGIDSVNISANTQISRALTGLELVLVLDVTGSMSWDAGGGVSKIEALKTAATSLVNNLFSTNPPEGKLWVGVVPFSQAVNIGTNHPTWMNDTYNNALASMPASQGPGWGPTSWGGCVDARFNNGKDAIDDPPSTADANTLFQQYYWPSDRIDYGAPYYNELGSGSNNWASKKYNRCKGGTCTSVTGSCSTSDGYTCTFTGYSYSSPLNTTSRGPNLYCPSEVLPMTNVKADIVNKINGLEARGNTQINQGAFWGWNMISPRWRGQWGGTMDANSLPLDYHTKGMSKAIVLLTDGENTQSNGSHGSYWYTANGKLGTTNSAGAVTAMNDRMTQICTAMKNKGIYVYTIMLGTDVSADNKYLLKSCATAPNYFFDSPTTTQLNNVFSAIGDSLSNLRVSK